VVERDLSCRIPFEEQHIKLGKEKRFILPLPFAITVLFKLMPHVKEDKYPQKMETKIALSPSFF